MEDDVDLTLGVRSGVPDTVAYLRASCPQDGWRSHASFGQLADFWLGVHAQLRTEGATIAALVRGLRDGAVAPEVFAPQFASALNRHLGHLDMHHRVEDHAYFPKFRALDPRMARAFDLLEADHAAIHEAIAETVGGARGLLGAMTLGSAARETDGFATISARLLRLLDRHLADEEEIVIPAMLVHGERRLA